MIVVVMLMMPFLGIGMASGVLSTISIPEFIMDYIRANSFLSILLCGVVFLLLALMMRWLYAFHYFTLEGCSFREARKRSCVLGKKKRVRDFGEWVLIQLFFMLGHVIFLFVAITLAVLIGKLFSRIFVLRWVITTWIWMAVLLSASIAAMLAVPVSYGCVSFLYYRHKEELSEPVIHSEAPPYNKNERQARFFHRCGIALGCVVVAGSLVLGYFLCSGRLNPQIEYVRMMEVTAQAELEDACVITSQVYEVLENVKAYDDSITTVYVMSLAYGDINQLTAADHFSVEATSATKALISRVHNEGKEIYAWTVNTEESINKMIELNVDNIITDNIELARQCINESRYSDLLTEYLKLFQ